jgi:hypothetical protein
MARNRDGVAHEPVSAGQHAVGFITAVNTANTPGERNRMTEPAPTMTSELRLGRVRSRDTEESWQYLTDLLSFTTGGLVR